MLVIQKKTLQIGKRQKLSNSIPVNLIRQWCYCPRVVYYMELTNVAFHRPIWVKQGEAFHARERQLWNRRNLSRFDLKNGKKYHNLHLRDSNLSLHGKVDMAIETDKAVYAVEFKLSANCKKRGDQLQLVAYAMLLEKHFLKPSQVGFLVGTGNVLHIISIDKHKRKSVVDNVKQIKTMLSQGVKPDSSASVFQCCNCEYVNFCNDR